MCIFFRMIFLAQCSNTFLVICVLMPPLDHFPELHTHAEPFKLGICA